MQIVYDNKTFFTIILVKFLYRKHREYNSWSLSRDITSNSRHVRSNMYRRIDTHD